MKTAIIAALPRELKALVAGWEQIKTDRSGVHLYQRDDVLAACAGMGVERAALAVEAVLAHARVVDLLISFGLAGACEPGLRAGEVRWCGSVVDARSGERFQTADAGPVLVTALMIAGTTEKRRLHASYAAALVDMEAAGVGRLARAHGLRFRALKAVSDFAEEAMDDMERFVTTTGQFRTAAFAAHLALRPARWRGAIALGRASAAGLTIATAELVHELTVAPGAKRP